MRTACLIVVTFLAVILGFSSARLERCLTGFTCKREGMRCTNVKYAYSSKAYNYEAPAPLGFACLPDIKDLSLGYYY